MANPQPITRLHDAPLPAQPLREVDFAMVQFRYEVLGEALSTLARENQLNLVVLQALAKDQDWQVLSVSDQVQEDRLTGVVQAANLRLNALTAFREIEKFQRMAALEDAAMAAATRKLQDPDLSPGQVASIAAVIKTIRYGQATQAQPELQPKPVRVDCDIRTD